MCEDADLIVGLLKSCVGSEKTSLRMLRQQRKIDFSRLLALQNGRIEFLQSSVQVLASLIDIIELEIAVTEKNHVLVVHQISFLRPASQPVNEGIELPPPFFGVFAVEQVGIDGQESNVRFIVLSDDLKGCTVRLSDEGYPLQATYSSQYRLKGELKALTGPRRTSVGRPWESCRIGIESRLQTDR